MTLSFNTLTLSLMEVVSASLSETDPKPDGRTFSTDLFEQKLYYGSRGWGLACRTFFAFKDGILMADTENEAVLNAIKKTEIAFLFFIEEAYKVQQRVREDCGSEKDRNFLLQFSQTFKSLKHLSKGTNWTKIKQLFSLVFPDPKLQLDSLTLYLKPFFQRESITRFESKTRKKVPIDLFRRLSDLKEPEKEQLREWITLSLIPHDAAWYTTEYHKSWAEERVNELPKVLYAVFDLVTEGQFGRNFPRWMCQLKKVIGEYKWKPTDYRFPSEVLAPDREEVRADGLFSMHEEVVARLDSKPLIPLSQILYADPYGKGIIKEKLKKEDPKAWAPVLLRKIFETGQMPALNVSQGLKPSFFGFGIDDELKSTVPLIRCEIDFTLIDDFVWEVSEGDWEVYRRIYHEANIVETHYGKIFRIIGIYRLPEMGNEFEKPSETALRMKLDTEFIIHQVVPFDLYDRASMGLDRDFMDFWINRSWEFFPGLWYRHNYGTPPREKFNQFVEETKKRRSPCTKY